MIYHQILVFGLFNGHGKIQADGVVSCHFLSRCTSDEGFMFHLASFRNFYISVAGGRKCLTKTQDLNSMKSIFNTLKKKTAEKNVKNWGHVFAEMQGIERTNSLVSVCSNCCLKAFFKYHLSIKDHLRYPNYGIKYTFGQNWWVHYLNHGIFKDS